MKQEREIVCALDVAIAFLERSMEHGKRAVRHGKEDVLLAASIISGTYPCPCEEIRFELREIVGLALMGTRYSRHKRRLFHKEWNQFFRMEDMEQTGEFLTIFCRIRDDILKRGISSGESKEGWRYEELSAELKWFSL